MTFHEKGFRSLATPLGQPSDTSAAGEIRQWHTFTTNDDLAAIETSNYFDALLSPKRVKNGDLLTVLGDIDGTVFKRDYIIDLTTSAGHVTLKREGTSAGKGLNTLAMFVNLADLANGDMLTNYVPGYNFKIEKFDFRVAKPATTAAKAATLNLEIGTTDVTGGVIALTSANCTPAGAAVAGSAITAANVGGPTDSISVEASSVTAFVEGNGWMLLLIRNLDD